MAGRNDSNYTFNNSSNCEYESSTYQDNQELFDLKCYGTASIIGLFGIVGNVISIIILTRPQMKSLMNYLLTGLAASDIVLIFNTILLCFLPAAANYYRRTYFLVYYYYNINAYLTVAFQPIAMMAQTATVYFTLTVTLERYMAVFHPLQTRMWCTNRRARAYTLAVVIFSILYNFIRFWEYDIVILQDDNLNMTFHGYGKSTLMKNHLYVAYYYNWAYLVFMFLLPLTTISILNAAIYLQIKRANKARQTLTHFQENEIRLAFMLLCVVVVFVLCHLLTVIIRISICFEWENFWGMSVLHQLIPVNNTLVTINSSVNFILYIIFGKKFKKMAMKTFCSYKRPS